MINRVPRFFSAFPDALTVTAVIITVAVDELHKSDLEQFRSFLRSLMMHALDDKVPENSGH
ncbi:MAG: hypothetical protein L3J58_11640 [Emcibacter sp.]|nr:hypothetical protein [Emcibacter sp.]